MVVEGRRRRPAACAASISTQVGQRLYRERASRLRTAGRQIVIGIDPFEARVAGRAVHLLAPAVGAFEFHARSPLGGYLECHDGLRRKISSAPASMAM